MFHHSLAEKKKVIMIIQQANKSNIMATFNDLFTVEEELRDLIRRRDYESIAAWIRRGSDREMLRELLWKNDPFLGAAPVSCIQLLADTSPEIVHMPRSQESSSEQLLDRNAIHRFLSSTSGKYCLNNADGNENVERNSEVLHILIQSAPQAVCKKIKLSGQCSYALHLVFNTMYLYVGLTDSVFDLLVETFPAAVRLSIPSDILGRWRQELPLHRACRTCRMSKHQFETLLSVYPDAANIPNEEGQVPMFLIIQRSGLFCGHGEVDENRRKYVDALLDFSTQSSSLPIPGPGENLVPFMYAASQRELGLTFHLLLKYVTIRNLISFTTDGRGQN
jgi:hypothetical protein